MTQSLSMWHINYMMLLYSGCRIRSWQSTCSHLLRKQVKYHLLLFTRYSVNIPLHFAAVLLTSSKTKLNETLIWICCCCPQGFLLFVDESILIKKKTKLSSHMRKFKWDRVEKVINEEGLSNIWGNAQIFSLYMRRPLGIYYFASDPSEYPNIWGKFSFLFYQCIRWDVCAGSPRCTTGISCRRRRSSSGLLNRRRQTPSSKLPTRYSPNMNHRHLVGWLKIWKCSKEEALVTKFNGACAKQSKANLIYVKI